MQTKGKCRGYIRGLCLFMLFFGISITPPALRFSAGGILLFARPVIEEQPEEHLSYMPPREFALALEALIEDSPSEGVELPKIPDVSIRSYSGTPLLLEISISDPDRLVRAVTVAGDVSRFSYRPETEPGEIDPGLIDIKLTPFLKPGIHELTVILETEAGNLGRSFRIGFVEYVWGRDNFRYPNLGIPPESFRVYSELLFAWGKERFGSISEIEKVIMLYNLYNMFGDRTGRCYAFSGSQVRYRLFPDLLPSWCRSVYDIRETARAIQIEMDFYQKDIVFHQFIHKGMDIHAEQADHALLRELETILEGIEQQVPVVVGYLGGEEHHSMVVYGFIQDNDTGSMLLINANNWQEEADINIFSKDVELISLNPTIQWLGRDGRERGKVERLYAVEIQKEFSHSREVFDQFVQAFRDDLLMKNESILVIENAENIYVTDDDGKKSGYYQRCTLQEIDQVYFQKVDSNYILRFPADRRFGLYIKAPDCDASASPEEQEKQQLSYFLIAPGEEGIKVNIEEKLFLPCGEAVTGTIEEGRIQLLMEPEPINP